MRRFNPLQFRFITTPCFYSMNARAFCGPVQTSSAQSTAAPSLKSQSPLANHIDNYQWTMAQIRQGQAFANQGQYGQALKAYRACVELTTHEELIPALYNHMGTCYLKSGELEKCLSVLENGLELAQKTEEAGVELFESFHLNIAHCKTRMEDFAGAIEAFQMALDFHGQKAKANPEALSLLYFKIAELFYRQANKKQALKNCVKAIDLDSDNHRAFRLQGEVYRSSKDFKKSMKAFKQAISIIAMAKRSRKLGVIYLQLAEVLEEMKNYPESLKYYMKALEHGCKDSDVKPKHPELAQCLQSHRKS